MANPVFIGSNSTATTPTTSVHFNYTCTTGNALVISGAGPLNATLTITDQNNNTFNNVYTINSTPANATFALWIATNITGSNEQFTLTSSTSGAVELILAEYSGLNTSGVQDGHNSGTGSTTAMSSGNITTTNAEDLLIAYLGPATSISNAGTGWTSRVTTTFSNVLAEKIVSSTGTYSNDATQSTTGTYVDAIAAFTSPGTGTTLRPGPLSGSWKLTGAAPPRIILRPVVVPGGISSGTLGVAGRVNSPARPFSGGNLGTVSVSGVVHGRLNTPNAISVSGTQLLFETVIRPLPGASNTILTSAVVVPRLSGTLRPFAAGAITLVDTTLFIRLNPFRPFTAQTNLGTLTWTGTVTPRFVGAPQRPFSGGNLGNISLTPSTVFARLILRPFLFPGITSGTVMTQGEVTAGGATGPLLPRLTLRPNAAGTISLSGSAGARFFSYPHASGLVSLSALLTFHTGGVLRPLAGGTISVGNPVFTPRFNPYRPFNVVNYSTLTILTSAIINFELVLPLPPPIIVTTTGFYVVLSVYGTNIVWFLVAMIDYSSMIRLIHSGPYATYPLALAALQALVADGSIPA